MTNTTLWTLVASTTLIHVSCILEKLDMNLEADIVLDFRSGLYPKEFPYTVGQDAVGTLVQGPSSSDIRFDIPLGTTVFTPAGSSFAEYLVAPASRVGVIPEGVDHKDGVSWSTVGLTALALAKESYPVKKGDWVLIRAAAGGVGLVLTQIVKYLGGHVIGTVSSQDKAELVKSYGADLVLLSTNPSEDNVQKILEVTNGGVHGVYDGVGKDTWEEDFQVVRRKGTIVTFGNASVSQIFSLVERETQADMVLL